MLKFSKAGRLLFQAKKIFILYFGNLVAAAISIVVLPIIARVYTPSDFGVFQLFLAWVSIFGSIASLGLHEALFVSGGDQNDKNSVGFYSIILAVSSVFLSTAFLGVYFSGLSTGFSAGDFALFFLTLYTGGIFKFYQSYCVFSEKLRALVIAIILFSLFSNIAKLIFGILNPSYYSLIFSISFGYILTAICCYRSFPSLQIPSTFRLFGKYITDFSSLISGGTLSQFLGAVIAWFSVFSSSFVGYSSEQIGLIAMALTLVQTPLYPLIHASYNNLISQCSKKFDDKNPILSEVYKNLLINFMLASVIILFYQILTAHFLFIFLGEAWAGVKSYIFLMLAPAIFSLILSPAYRTQALLSGKQIYLFYIDLVVVIALLTLAFIARINSLSVLYYLVYLSTILSMAHIFKFILFHKFRHSNFETRS